MENNNFIWSGNAHIYSERLAVQNCDPTRIYFRLKLKQAANPNDVKKMEAWEKMSYRLNYSVKYIPLWHIRDNSNLYLLLYMTRYHIHVSPICLRTFCVYTNSETGTELIYIARDLCRGSSLP